MLFVAFDAMLLGVMLVALIVLFVVLIVILIIVMCVSLARCCDRFADWCVVRFV